MNEQEWLACKNPCTMLEVMRTNAWESGGLDRPSDRKLRLFACAVTRQGWHLLTDHRSRNAVEVAERFADEMVDMEALYRAWKVARDDTVFASGTCDEGGWYQAAYNAVNLCYTDTRIVLDRVVREPDPCPSGVMADLLHDIMGNPWQMLRSARCSSCYGSGQVPHEEPPQIHVMIPRMEACRDCRGTGRFDLSWVFRQWNTPTVLRLAHGIYADRDWPAMPILADALQDAGCEHAPLLAHLRGPGPHARGCHALDALLGLS